MIAMPHLAFLTVLFVAGLIAWQLDLDRKDTPLVIVGTVIAGLSAGILLGAWVA